MPRGPLGDGVFRLLYPQVHTKLTRGLFLCALLSLAGCGTLPRNAVPPALMSEAVIPGMPDARAPAGRPSKVMADDLRRSFMQESAGEFPIGPDGVIRYPHLALSGGGANGAFGAGFLNGWSNTGQRPVFKIVTGVSTGALIAPFAFLGPEHDDALRQFFTTTASRNIFRVLSIVPQLIAGESFADTAPLRALIEEHVTAEFLRQIAQAHEGGRRLYLGTVDLDSQRFMVWNMGLIATSGRPEALDLFRAVMLASASVPVAFPPVLFEVEAGGKRYDEMHVDGGVALRVFYSGGVFSFSTLRAEDVAGRGPGRETIFIIHNGQLPPVPDATARSLRSIAARTFSSASKAAFVGDLFRIYGFALREQADFQWVTIPDGFELAGDEIFDPVRMGKLYEVGYQKALAGQQWVLEPPGLARDRPADPMGAEPAANRP